MREAVIELHRVQLSLSEDCDDWRPDTIGRGSGGDPTAAAAIYRVDVLGAKRDALRAQESDLIDEIGEAGTVIEAVRDSLGDRYADTLDQRYIDLRSWDEIEVDGEEVPKSTSVWRVDVACDWIDSIGWHAVLSGVREV